MANPSKQKGTKCETDTVRYLRANGFPLAERRALAGNADRGDILACPGVIVECKHWATYTDTDIATWLAETWREKGNANADEALLVIRRNGKANPADWWAWRYLKGHGWHCTWLNEAVHQLRMQGWGEPHA